MEIRTKLFLSLLAGVALLHSGALRNGFVWDDGKMIVTNPGIRDLANVPAMFKRNYFGERANSELYRPMVNVSLAGDYALWGKDEEGRPIPLPYHLTNVLLHLAAGVLLYTVLRRLTDRPWLPEAASLIFLVHPASAEPVAWIVARGDLLSTVLALGAVHLHLSGQKRWPLHVLALLLYFAALFSKLAIAPLPILILLLTKRDLVRCATYAIPAALYLLVRSAAMPSLFPQGPGVTWNDPEFVSGGIVAGAVTFRLFWIALFPAGLCADYSADPVADTRELTSIASSWPVLLMALAVPVVVTIAILERRRAPLVSMGLLWFFVALLPVSQAIRIGAVMADRFLYFPSIGIAIAMAAGVLYLPRHRIVVLTLLLGFFGAVTVHREAVWRDEGSMRADVLAPSNYPEHADSWNWLGKWYGEAGRRSDEIEAYREGLRHEPSSRYLRLCLGGALYQSGRLPEARTVLTRAFRQRPPGDLLSAQIAYNLAKVMLKQDQAVDAVVVLEDVVDAKPPLPEALDLLAKIYEERLGRQDRATRLRERARKIREDARRALAGR